MYDPNASLTMLITVCRTLPCVQRLSGRNKKKSKYVFITRCAKVLRVRFSDGNNTEQNGPGKPYSRSWSYPRARWRKNNNKHQFPLSLGSCVMRENLIARIIMQSAGFAKHLGRVYKVYTHTHCTHTRTRIREESFNRRRTYTHAAPHST